MLKTLRLSLVSVPILLGAACTTSSKIAPLEPVFATKFETNPEEQKRIMSSLQSLENGDKHLLATVTNQIANLKNEKSPVKPVAQFPRPLQSEVKSNLRSLAYTSFLATSLKDEELKSETLKIMKQWAAIYMPAQRPEDEKNFRGLAVSYAYFKNDLSPEDRKIVSEWLVRLFPYTVPYQRPAAFQDATIEIGKIVVAADVALSNQRYDLALSALDGFRAYLNEAYDETGYLKDAKTQKKLALHIFNTHEFLSTAIAFHRAGLITTAEVLGEGRPLRKALEGLKKRSFGKFPDREWNYASYAFQPASYFDPSFDDLIFKNDSRTKLNSASISFAYYQGIREIPARTAH